MGTNNRNILVEKVDESLEKSLQSSYKEAREQRIPNIRQKLLQSSRSYCSPRIPVTYSNSFRPCSNQDLKDLSLLRSTISSMQDTSIDTESSYGHKKVRRAHSEKRWDVKRY